MALRLVRNVGPRTADGGARQESTAAFLLINGRGGVIEAQGWEALSMEPVPESIPASADASGTDDPVLRGIVAAVGAARRGRRPTIRLVEVALQRAHVFVIVAFPLPGPGRSGSIAVTVAETGPPEAGSVEGKVIRQLGHDLRTPLTSISGAVELLQSGRLGALQEGQIKVVGLMEKGSAALLKLIDEATAPYHGRRDLASVLGVGVEELVAGSLEDGADPDADPLDAGDDEEPRGGAAPGSPRRSGRAKRERGR